MNEHTNMLKTILYYWLLIDWLLIDWLLIDWLLLIGWLLCFCTLNWESFALRIFVFLVSPDDHKFLQNESFCDKVM